MSDVFGTEVSYFNLLPVHPLYLSFLKYSFSFRDVNRASQFPSLYSTNSSHLMTPIKIRGIIPIQQFAYFCWGFAKHWYSVCIAAGCFTTRYCILWLCKGVQHAPNFFNVSTNSPPLFYCYTATLWNWSYLVQILKKMVWLSFLLDWVLVQCKCMMVLECLCCCPIHSCCGKSTEANA